MLLSDNSQSSAGVKLSVPLSIGIKEGSRFIYASAPGGNVAMETVDNMDAKDLWPNLDQHSSLPFAFI